MVLLLAAVSGAEENTAFKVTYISAENVYIDGGNEDGLLVGDTLLLKGKDKDTVLVEIQYVAGHSASCRKISGIADPVIGDRFIIQASALSDDMPVTEETTADAPVELPEISSLKSGTVSERIAKPSTKVKGNVALRYYYWSDQSPANLDFSQTNTRLNLKVHHLWNEHITFVLRSRGRYDARRQAYSNVDKSSWENRLWELSLVYDNEESGLSIAVGRILPQNLAASGYLDGVQMEFDLSESVRLGMLGGSRPDWLYQSIGSSLNRGGAYATYNSRGTGKLQFEQTLAGIGEAHSDRISRSYLISTGRISYSSNWGINHNVEIDINAGWRKDRAGQTVAVSRAYVYGYYKLIRNLRLGLSYDNLKRYWTYEYMGTADSLFDDRIRQGWKARADYSVSGKWFLSGSLGMRSHPDKADPTITYSMNFRRSGLLTNTVTVAAMYSAFDGPHEHGANYFGQIQLFSAMPGVIHVTYGHYQYAVDEIDEDRSSWYLEAGLDTDFGRNYYMGGSIQYNTGADIKGWKFQSELGYRL